MHYQEFAPSPALEPLVLCYWRFEVAADTPPPVLHSAPPDGCVSLLVFQPGVPVPPVALWAGPRTANLRQEVPPGSVFTGIRFVPGVPRALFGLEMAGLKNAARPVLAELDRHPTLAALVQAMAAAPLNPEALNLLLEPLAPGTTDTLVEPLVREILATHGRVDIGGLTRRAGRSERQVQKRFKEAVGLTMKELAGSRRLRATIVQLLLDEGDYFGTLEMAGYFDQAHFGHEFRRSAGTALGEFRTYVRRIRHTDVRA